MRPRPPTYTLFPYTTLFRSQTLVKLQKEEIDLGGIEKDVAAVVAPELLAYNDNWQKLDAMLKLIGSQTYRRAMLDSRSEEHTSELQSRLHLVCRLLLEKKKK